MVYIQGNNWFRFSKACGPPFWILVIQMRHQDHNCYQECPPRGVVRVFCPGKGAGAWRVGKWAPLSPPLSTNTLLSFHCEPFVENAYIVGPLEWARTTSRYWITKLIKVAPKHPLTLCVSVIGISISRYKRSRCFCYEKKSERICQQFWIF